eukprot:GHRQ01038473.1.p3 GENE.GHRQ01038473.1~~GHRQ01038473.1.p3  ORF type:complete len:111 (+),score=20.99 GHRQ01038473.1:373-705(+)
MQSEVIVTVYRPCQLCHLCVMQCRALNDYGTAVQQCKLTVYTQGSSSCNFSGSIRTVHAAAYASYQQKPISSTSCRIQTTPAAGYEQHPAAAYEQHQQKHQSSISCIPVL